MKKLTIILITIILVLTAGNAYFYFKYFPLKAQFDNLSKTKQINGKIATFNKLFVDKVLIEQGEVSYEDRLKLENAVIDTQDEEIINEWHAFLNSKTEADAQKETKKLLYLFANKVIY